MKKLWCVCCLVWPSMLLADDALIGVYCLENTNGARVYLNNDLIFECVDFKREPIVVAEGTHTLKAVLPISEEQEKVFSAVVDAKANLPTRIRISLPIATLTAYGVEMQKQRAQAEEQRLAQSKARQKEADAKSDIQKAESGDLEAMNRVAKRYTSGDGLVQDNLQATLWADRYQAAVQQKNRQAKIQSLQQQLDVNPYFYWLKNTPDALSESGSLSSLIITALPSITLFDLVSSPSVYSTRKNIQEQIDALETHAVRWAKPDSMIAKSFK